MNKTDREKYLMKLRQNTADEINREKYLMEVIKKMKKNLNWEILHTMTNLIQEYGKKQKKIEELKEQLDIERNHRLILEGKPLDIPLAVLDGKLKKKFYNK